MWDSFIHLCYITNLEQSRRTRQICWHTDQHCNETEHAFEIGKYFLHGSRMQQVLARSLYTGPNIISSTHNALAQNRTQNNCLKGSYAYHYTTNAPNFTKNNMSWLYTHLDGVRPGTDLETSIIATIPAYVDMHQWTLCPSQWSLNNN